MLKIQPLNYQFCPFCGNELQVKSEERKKRKFCASCHWTYYPHVASAVAAVIIKEGKVLMVKRRREPEKGKWVFPAGYIDFGEHPLEALAREVKEETGLNIKKSNLVKIFQAEDDPREPGHFVFFYRVMTSGGKIKTDEEENEKIAWIDLKNLPKIGWKAHRHMIRLLQKRKD